MTTATNNDATARRSINKLASIRCARKDDEMMRPNSGLLRSRLLSIAARYIFMVMQGGLHSAGCQPMTSRNLWPAIEPFMTPTILLEPFDIVLISLHRGPGVAQVTSLSSLLPQSGNGHKSMRGYMRGSCLLVRLSITRRRYVHGKDIRNIHIVLYIENN